MNEGRFDKATATRRALLLGLAATAAAPLIGCARTDDGPKLVTADGVKRAQPPADAPVSTSAAGLSAFGHRLVQAAAKPGENFVVSPLSIAIAFAMARVGAAGRTAEQIDAAFGFPADGRDEAFNAITSRLVTADVPPKPDGKERKADGKKLVPVVSLGNGLFPQKGFPIGQAFLRTLAEQYAAGVRPVDFGGDDAAKQINAWVDQQTAGRIKQLFDHLDGTTRLVLANTVYFKADWQSIFAGAAPAPFSKADGTVIQAPTMRDTLKVRYAETAGIQAVELPYAGGPYAMWLMLPSAGGKPADALNPAVFGKLGSALAERTVEVSVPRWDFASTTDLKAVLGGLGVTAAFGPGADFGGIAPDLYIDQAVHKANITVDEWGTEAAAVTGISFAVSGPPPADAKFLADRPFAFAIVGGDDHIPLFIGCVTDPSAK